MSKSEDFYISAKKEELTKIIMEEFAKKHAENIERLILKEIKQDFRQKKTIYN